MSDYVYRLHGGSITHQQADVARQFYEAQARHFLQQRVEQGRDDLQRGTPPAPPVNGKGNAAPISTAAHVQGMLVGESWRQHRAGQKGKSLVTGVRARPGAPRASPRGATSARLPSNDPNPHNSTRCGMSTPWLALRGSGTLERAAKGKPPGRPVGIGCPAAELHSAFWTHHSAFRISRPLPPAHPFVE